uniref:Uncharacterized protein n=1 Tax=Oryza nivara TaxID=4536 RepID=A0A0E0HKG1_ORYNI
MFEIVFLYAFVPLPPLEPLWERLHAGVCQQEPHMGENGLKFAKPGAFCSLKCPLSHVVIETPVALGVFYLGCDSTYGWAEKRQAEQKKGCAWLGVAISPMRAGTGVGFNPRGVGVGAPIMGRGGGGQTPAGDLRSPKDIHICIHTNHKILHSHMHIHILDIHIIHRNALWNKNDTIIFTSSTKITEYYIHILHIHIIHISKKTHFKIPQQFISVVVGSFSSSRHHDAKRQAGTGEEATRERKFHWKQRRHAMATRGQEGTCGTASGIARRGRPRGAGVSTLAGMRCDGGRRRTVRAAGEGEDAVRVDGTLGEGNLLVSIHGGGGGGEPREWRCRSTAVGGGSGGGRRRRRSTAAAVEESRGRAEGAAAVEENRGSGGGGGEPRERRCRSTAGAVAVGGGGGGGRWRRWADGGGKWRRRRWTTMATTTIVRSGRADKAGGVVKYGDHASKEASKQ